jgi:hypothetical protein
VDDGSCVYPPPPVLGCMNATATNYDENATVDDSSCVYPPPPVLGCMNATATNYDENATVGDDSCVYPPPPEPPADYVEENSSDIESEPPQKSGIIENINMVHIVLIVVIILLLSLLVLLQSGRRR